MTAENVDEITLGPLPKHAVRYLANILHTHREGLAMISEDLGYSLQNLAAHDSLDCLESVIPDDIWEEMREIENARL